MFCGGGPLPRPLSPHLPLLLLLLLELLLFLLRSSRTLGRWMLERGGDLLELLLELLLLLFLLRSRIFSR